MDPDGRFAMAFRKVLRRPQILVIPKKPHSDVPDVNVIKFQKPHGSSCFPMKFSIKFSINEPFIPLQCLFLHGGRNFKARWAPDGSTVDQVARWQTEATPCSADVSRCSTMAHIKPWYSHQFPKDHRGFYQRNGAVLSPSKLHRPGGSRSPDKSRVAGRNGPSAREIHWWDLSWDFRYLNP